MKKNKKFAAEPRNQLLLAVTFALLIAIGFIIWQNFIYRADSYTTSGIVSAGSEDPGAKNQTRFLTLDNWSVKVPLKDTSYYYRATDYVTLNADDQIYTLSTRSLRVACNNDNATIGSIERVLENADNAAKIGASDVKGTKVLGKYLYIFTAPKTNCSDSPDVIRLQENATKEFIPLLSTLTTNE